MISSTHGYQGRCPTLRAGGRTPGQLAGGSPSAAGAEGRTAGSATAPTPSVAGRSIRERQHRRKRTKRLLRRLTASAGTRRGEGEPWREEVVVEDRSKGRGELPDRVRLIRRYDRPLALTRLVRLMFTVSGIYRQPEQTAQDHGRIFCTLTVTLFNIPLAHLPIDRNVKTGEGCVMQTGQVESRADAIKQAEEEEGEGG